MTCFKPDSKTAVNAATVMFFQAFLHNV